MCTTGVRDPEVEDLTPGADAGAREIASAQSGCLPFTDRDVQVRVRESVRVCILRPNQNTGIDRPSV